MPHRSPDLESQESSSPIVTRAVASGLARQPYPPYRFPAWQKVALSLLGAFPQGAARFAISRYQSFAGLDPSLFHSLRTDSIAAARLHDYARLDEQFPAVTIGAALGGAAAHLALALGGPFLPHAFVFTLSGGAPDANPKEYFQRTQELALHIAANNPEALTVQHFDPVHDGWLTRHVNHLRLKLVDLPQIYKQFLRERLKPGGAVCLLNCQAKWLRYQVGPRSVFQVGGWGAIPARQFLEGSPRLSEYCAANHLRCCDWSLPGYPLETGSESEWGVEPGLAEAVENFCRQEGYRFVQVSLPEPHDYSRLAYHAVEAQVRRQGGEPSGVLVEMFSQFDTFSVLQSGLLPLWLVFNTLDSLAFLQEMIPAFPKGKPVFFSPLSTFTITPDLAPWHQWDTALQGLDWHNIGARQSHYPADAARVATWAEPLRQWARQHSHPLHATLAAEELQSMAGSLLTHASRDELCDSPPS